MGNAVSIEYAFASLLEVSLGSRGGVNDADVFRVGSPEALADVLERAAAALDARTKKAGLQADSAENGSPGARIQVAIEALRREATELRRLTRDEGETYQWRVIGALVSITAALLEQYE
jgi:hypothetical protein